MPHPGNLLSATTEMVDPNTSGWRVRLNCSTALASGGRNGPGCLRLSATAAGEMQAETVTAYPVSAGEVYHVLADASAAAQPERIGIEWLDGTLTPVGPITWSMTTATASTGWHRVSVAGPCPDGATRARVILSSTTTAAGALHYWENAYLGAPVRTSGNLLPFNVEAGGEISPSGWVAETNGTVGRTAPALPWSWDFLLAGGHVMTLTATDAGDTSMAVAERVHAQPGHEYLAYAYLGPPTTASTAWLELRFHDEGGNLLQATRGTLAAASTGLQRQRASAIAPAGTVTCSLAVGLTGATAGQVLRTEGVVITAAPPLRDGSVIPYAAASFEQGTGGWTVTSGPATIARSTPWGIAAVEGSYCLTVTSTTAAASILRSPRIPIDPSVTETADWRMEVSAQITAGSWTHVRRIRWYDASGDLLDTYTSSAETMPSPGWWYLAISTPAPAGASAAEIDHEITATSSASAFYMDRVALWPMRAPTSITPVPESASVTLTLRDLTAGQLISIWRVTSDGVRTLVRGPSGLMDRVLITGDLLILEDHEAPLGVPVQYRIEIHRLTGELAARRWTDPVTIAPGSPNYVWLKDPARPYRNTKVLVQRGVDWSRPIERTEHHVRGRRNAVVLSDVRGGLAGTLSIWTQGDADRTRLHWLLDSGSTLLLQAVPGMGVEDVYVSVGDITEGRVADYGREPWRTWDLALTQVDMPTTGTDGSGARVWQDILTEQPTWEAVRDRYATWEAGRFGWTGG